MSNELKSRFELPPGKFWCRRNGGRIRVTVDTCLSCSARGECNDYRTEMVKAGFGPEADHNNQEGEASDETRNSQSRTGS